VRDRAVVVLAIARDPGLRRIVLAYLGFNMVEAATWIAILVYAYAIGGAALAGIAAVVQLVPAGLVAPFAASAGDRFRRDHVLIAGYALQAATLAITAVAIQADLPPAVVIVLATLAASSLTLTRPVQGALLPMVTHRPDDLAAANSATQVAESLGIFLGPLIGGLLLGIGSAGHVFGAFAVVALASCILVTRLPVDRHAVTPRQAPSAGDVIRGSLDGFSLLGRERRVLLLVAVLSAAFIVVGALDVLVVAVAIDLLGIGQAWAGFLYAAFGLGGVIGALVSVSLVGRRRLTPSLAVSAILFGGPISTVALVSGAVPAAVLLAGSGVGSSLVTVAGRTLLQRATPEHVLARVFGVLEGLSMFALAAGSFATAVLIETLGIANALLAAGAFVPVVLVLSWLELRRIDHDAPAPDPVALGLLVRLPMFSPLSAPAMERILAGLARVEAPAGEVIIREGDVGERFYVIEDGRVGVTIEGQPVAERGPGDGFGEIALLRSVPRTATVTALTSVRLLAIAGPTFLAAITGHPSSEATAAAVAAQQLAHAAPRQLGR
jgi:MFS family permease